MKLEVQPISLAEAKRFIGLHHRHHKPPQGWMFGCAVNDGETVVGVATVGRPVSRMLQAREPYTLEVTRCCTDGTPHVASKLYAACWRAARALGYRRLVTYTLIEEPGTSLRAAGWKPLYQTAGGSWSRAERPRVDTHPLGLKTIWEIADMKGPDA
jgi:hypothetical protein